MSRIGRFLDQSHEILKPQKSKPKQLGSNESQSFITHFEHTDRRLESFIKSCKSVQSYLSKRTSLEKENVKNNLRLAKQALEDSQYKKIEFSGIFQDCWSYMRQNIEQECAQRMELLEQLEKRVINVLIKVLQGEVDSTRRQLSNEGKKNIKEYMQAYQSYAKSMERYKIAAQDWEVMLVSINRDYSGVWSPSPGVKIFEKESICYKKLEELKQDYINNIDVVNKCQKNNIVDQLNVVLIGARTVANLLVQNLMNVILQYSDIDRALGSCPIVNTVNPELTKRQSQSSSEASPLQIAPNGGILGNIGGPLQALLARTSFDYKTFAFEHLMGSIDCKDIPEPVHFRFDEHMMCDEATQVLTSKVRYHCMDQMTTQEQAAAIQSMMKSQRAQPQTTNFGGATPTIKGFNPEFITSCMIALRKLDGQKEEGLFRISGNSLRINHLFERSLDPNIVGQELHLEVMSERDVHTVAGTLKRHLRECTLLSLEESRNLSRCIDFPMTEEKLHELKIQLRQLPDQKRQLLTSIIEFCTELCENEDETKMNSHAAGISFGLSLFPELDTTRSTNLLKCLLSYRKETHPEYHRETSIDDLIDSNDELFRDF